MARPAIASATFSKLPHIRSLRGAIRSSATSLGPQLPSTIHTLGPRSYHQRYRPSVSTATFNVTDSRSPQLPTTLQTLGPHSYLQRYRLQVSTATSNVTDSRSPQLSSTLLIRGLHGYLQRYRLGLQVSAPPSTCPIPSQLNVLNIETAVGKVC